MPFFTNGMNDWASRRKNIYLVAIVFVLSSISFYIFWNFWYVKPSCFDNIKNGDETGIDCGGSCSLVCSASAIKPIVRWDPRIFEIGPGVWNALIYVENPNIDALAEYFPYTFNLYDEKNQLLISREGATILPNNKTVGIFEGGIIVPEGKTPKRSTFEFGNNISWKKVEDKDPEIEVTHSPVLRVESAPRIEARVKNNEIKDIENIELVAVIFDGRDNAIATSRTFIERLKAGGSADVFFTWPKPFDLGVKFCEKPSSVILAIDRSGSMASLSKNPPEPLSSVKQAASYFVSNLRENDKVGLVTFANTALNPTNFILTPDISLINSYIDQISILDEGTQYTNIADVFRISKQMFDLDGLSTDTNQNVLVLLTDGVATLPRNPVEPESEAEEIAYAEAAAEAGANLLKKDGVMVYTIGLGSEIHKDFLRKISSDPQNFLEAPATTTLGSVYTKISNSICKELPARIEITYKIFGNSNQ